MMTKAEEEQIKLTANWLNVVAAGIVVTGTVAPLIAYVLGTIPNGTVSPYIVGVGSIVSLVFGIALHVLARHSLKRLDR
jgi:hypothetical protein